MPRTIPCASWKHTLPWNLAGLPPAFTADGIGRMLLAWLLFYTALQIARPRLQPFLSRLSSAQLLISLEPHSVSITTATLNYAPRRLLDALPRIRSTRGRRTGGKRRLTWLYDLGGLASLAGLVVAQVALAWAAWRAIEVAMRVVSSGGHAGSPTPRLLKRAPIVFDDSPTSISPTQGLVLRPLVREIR